MARGGAEVGLSEAMASGVTALWLVRHGQTDWNLERRLQGQFDPDLNATGRAQAEALAARLAGRRFAALYTSDLVRARQTAAILGEHLGLAPRVDRRLREVHHGEWDGLLAAEIVRRYPEAWAARRADPLDVPPPGGETVRDVATRVAAAADAIGDAHAPGPVLVVSHGLALAILACLATGAALEDAFDRIPSNAEPELVHWAAH